MLEVSCDLAALNPKDRIRMALPKFPARYSQAVVDAMLPRLQGIRGTWLDPYAGQGLSLPQFVGPGHRVIGIEIEQPNVDAGIAHGAAGLIEQGDSTQLRKRFRKGSVAAIFSSPSYGNRFADSHNAQDNSRRRSYTHDIRELTGNMGYQLHEHNSGRMHFGDEYQAHHRLVLENLLHVARPGAPLLWNVSDFFKTLKKGEPQVRIHATTWHLIAAQSVGWVWVDAEPIQTQRMRDGENREARADNEWLLVFRKPQVT